MRVLLVALLAAAAASLGHAGEPALPDIDSHPFSSQVHMTIKESNQSVPMFMYYDGDNLLLKQQLKGMHQIELNILIRGDDNQRYLFLNMNGQTRCRVKAEASAPGGNLLFGWMAKSSKYAGSVTVKGETCDKWDRTDRSDSVAVSSANVNIPVLLDEEKTSTYFFEVVQRSYNSTFFAVPTACQNAGNDDSAEPDDDETPTDDDDDEPHPPPPHHGSGSRHGIPPHGGSRHGHHNHGGRGSHGGSRHGPPHGGSRHGPPHGGSRSGPPHGGSRSGPPHRGSHMGDLMEGDALRQPRLRGHEGNHEHNHRMLQFVNEYFENHA